MNNNTLSTIQNMLKHYHTHFYVEFKFLKFCTKQYALISFYKKTILYFKNKIMQLWHVKKFLFLWINIFYKFYINFFFLFMSIFIFFNVSLS